MQDGSGSALDPRQGAEMLSVVVSGSTPQLPTQRLYSPCSLIQFWRMPASCMTHSQCSQTLESLEWRGLKSQADGKPGHGFPLGEVKALSQETETQSESEILTSMAA